MGKEALQESPVIRAPEDGTHRGLLQTKWGQYKTWLETNLDVPNIRTSQRAYAAELLSELFQADSGQIKTDDVKSKLSSIQGDLFHTDNFDNACIIIGSYTTNPEFLQKSVNQFERQYSANE